MVGQLRAWTVLSPPGLIGKKITGEVIFAIQRKREIELKPSELQILCAILYKFRFDFKLVSVKHHSFDNFPRAGGKKEIRGLFLNVEIIFF